MFLGDLSGLLVNVRNSDFRNTFNVKAYIQVSVGFFFAYFGILFYLSFLEGVFVVVSFLRCRCVGTFGAQRGSRIDLEASKK